jgi:hypothetical protein
LNSLITPLKGFNESKKRRRRERESLFSGCLEYKNRRYTHIKDADFNPFILLKSVTSQKILLSLFREYIFTTLTY